MPRTGADLGLLAGLAGAAVAAGGGLVALGHRPGPSTSAAAGADADGADDTGPA